MSSDDKEPIDIGSLLAAALDDKPPTDMTERVMTRLAGVKTAVEFGRLLGVAPISTLLNIDDDDDDDLNDGPENLVSEDDDDPTE